MSCNIVHWQAGVHRGCQGLKGVRLPSVGPPAQTGQGIAKQEKADFTAKRTMRAAYPLSYPEGMRGLGQREPELAALDERKLVLRDYVHADDQVEPAVRAYLSGDMRSWYLVKRALYL